VPATIIRRHHRENIRILNQLQQPSTKHDFGRGKNRLFPIRRAISVDGSFPCGMTYAQMRCQKVGKFNMQAGILLLLLSSIGKATDRTRIVD
jgi:hypothetical protein